MTPPKHSNRPKTHKILIPSELRHDPVSHDWVVIATGRAKRPEQFRKEHGPKLKDSVKDCPFEDMGTQEYPTQAFFRSEKVTEYPDNLSDLKWTTIAFPNKFPAFAPGHSLRARTVGPYQVMDSVGYHEVIVTKNHHRDIPEFTNKEVLELIDMYQERYLSLMNEANVNYVSIFKNKGPAAGATVAHPHSQLIASPVTDPDIQRSLHNSLEYQGEKSECVHCAMIAWDREDGKRVVFENDCFIVVCPFASRVAFEMRIYPTEHFAYFERVNSHQKECLADALRAAMQELYRALGDPDYNYFIHTAPCDGENYDHYHWHFEILPKTATWAGFELGTGIEISTIEPEKAAEFLRKQDR